MFQTAQNPGVGPSVKNVEFNVYNRTGGAVVIGAVLMLDHLAADAGGFSAASYGTTLTQGLTSINVDGGEGASNGATWPWGNALTPTAAGIGTLSGGAGVGTGSAGSPIVVVTGLYDGAGANDTKIKVCIQGLLPIKCITTEPVVFGDTLYAEASVQTVTPLLAAAGLRPVAKALGAKADNATHTVMCFFNGWNIFSPQAAS